MNVCLFSVYLLNRPHKTTLLLKVTSLNNVQYQSTRGGHTRCGLLTERRPEVNCASCTRYCVTRRVSSSTIHAPSRPPYLSNSWSPVLLLSIKYCVCCHSHDWRCYSAVLIQLWVWLLCEVLFVRGEGRGCNCAIFIWFLVSRFLMLITGEFLSWNIIGGRKWTA